jgi:hypothetical protein
VTSALEPGAGEPDSRGCRLLVASYSDVAPVVRAVTARARDHILQSPTLGDFVDLLFADLGARPDQQAEPDPAGHADAVARVVTALTQPSQDADLSYFALLIADRSAAAAARVLASCEADPVIGALPMRCRVLASIDDRACGADTAVEVNLPPDGPWRRDDLVAEVQHYAEELLMFFSAGHKRGLTLAELNALRPPAAGPADAPAGEQAAETADALAPSPILPVPEPSPRELESPEPSPRELEPPEPSPRELESAVPTATVAGPPRPPRPRSFPRLRGPRVRREPAPESEPPAASVVVYLVLAAAESAPDRAGWRRGRSVLVELDKRLARTPGVAYLTRMLDATVPGDDKLRPAGRLSARDIRHPASFLDFAAALGSVPAVLRADYQRAVQEAPLTAPPVLVIYAADAPLADAITSARYAVLAAKVPVLWILPGTSARLLSAVFRDGTRVHVSTDHPAIATELVTLITRTAGSETSSTTAPS